MPNTEELKHLQDKIDTLTGTINKQGEDWTSEIADMKDTFDEFEDRLDSHSDSIRSLMQWRDSNGSPGAEDRIRCVERFFIDISRENLPPRLNMVEAEIDALQKYTDSAIFNGVQGAVNDTLDRRAKTTIEKIKAWGPIVSAALAAAAIVLAEVL